MSTPPPVFPPGDYLSLINKYLLTNLILGRQPNIVINNGYSIVSLAEDVTLTCEYFGKRPDRFWWIFKHESVEKKFPLNVKTSENFLKIERANKNNTGEYICFAENRYGVSESSGFVRLKLKPIQLSSTYKELSINEDFTVFCEGEKDVYWGFDSGETIPNGIVIDKEKLIINFHPRQQGVYTCRNKFGSEEFILKAKSKSFCYICH